jgi:DNA (cytosine-5)-methyltransferase 1
MGSKTLSKPTRIKSPRSQCQVTQLPRGAHIDPVTSAFGEDVIGDLFAGSGGTSTGIIDAWKSIGEDVQLFAINHWNVAVATHQKNHPEQRHFCADLDNIDPKEVVPSGKLRALVASPVCTHFSNALGGEPMNKQLRATIKYVMWWVTALSIPDILIENVREFKTWGPLHRTHSVSCRNHDHSQLTKKDNNVCHFNRPIKSRKGQYFNHFIHWLELRGYVVEHRLLKCCNYGDATSRERLFIRARQRSFMGGKILWPEATHGDPVIIEQPNLFDTHLRPWRTARDILDLEDKGKSIFEPVFGPRGNQYLSPNTMRRIFSGFFKFNAPFILPNEGFYRGNAPRPLDKPLNTVTAGRGAGNVVSPYLVEFHGEARPSTVRAKEIDDPMPTIATNHTPALAQPYLIQYHGTSLANAIDAPIPSHPASGNHLGMATPDPFLVGTAHKGANGSYAYPSDRPLPTITTQNEHGVVTPEPFLVHYRGSSTANDVDRPLPTQTAKEHFALAQPATIQSHIDPFLLGIRGGNDGYLRASAADEPLPTVTTSPAMAVLNSCLIHLDHTNDLNARAIDRPVPTLTSADALGLIVPVNHGKDDRRAHELSRPFPAITSVDAWGLAEYLVEFHGDKNSKPRTRTTKKPLPTQDTSNRFGLAQPYIVKYYGTGGETSTAEPLPTVTGKERFALCVPVTDGYILVDILFRMVKWQELARAHSQDNYQFEGSREEIVKQIGNSVPRMTALALALSIKAKTQKQLTQWQEHAVAMYLDAERVK